MIQKNNQLMERSSVSDLHRLCFRPMRHLPVKRLSLLTVLCWFGFSMMGMADKVRLRVTVENLMPAQGALVTPPWVGFHEGQFDLFDTGSPASESLERLAEDGNHSIISDAFDMSVPDGVQGVLNDIGPIPPGSKVQKDFVFDGMPPSYFSYAAMLIPSNDAFISNSDPMAYALWGEGGMFKGVDLMLTAASVYDAGTEVNDELPETTPALGQMTPNTGMSEMGIVHRHEGLKATGAGGVVDRKSFANADFTQIEGGLVRIRIEKIEPDPVTISVRIENTAPDKGVYFTPVWLGFHDGSVRVFEPGQSASPALERIAEDGDPSALNAWFQEQPGQGFTTVVASSMQPPVFAPGTAQEIEVELDRENPHHQFLSFISMVIPSNDAFIGASEPIQLFDENGQLITDTITLDGATVWDAGTEVNSEAPEATPLLGQMNPNTGTSEEEVVRVHPGFKAVGMGGVLDQSMFAAADFKQPGYTIFGLWMQTLPRLVASLTETGMVHLWWAEGKPPYQLQFKSSAQDAAWTDLGDPVADNQLTVSADQAMGFFRILSLGGNMMESVAKYRLTFQSSWSAATHPDMFPGNPHFSGLIGATHNREGSFWEPGGLASPGVKNVAETGGKSPFRNEIQDAIETGWAHTLISGGGIGRSPGATSVEFEAHSDYPLLTLISMIAPSPDWLVGTHGFDLRSGGSWIDAVTIELFPYDAGTDDGISYASPNAASKPQEAIHLLTGKPFLHDGMILPLGAYELMRI